DPMSGTVVITPTANTCTGPTGTFTITVNPTPVLNTSLTPDAICAGSEFEYTPASLTQGTSFTWVREAVAGIDNPAGSGTGAIAEVLTSEPGGEKGTVVYLYRLMANGCENEQTITVDVQPLPVTPF